MSAHPFAHTHTHTHTQWGLEGHHRKPLDLPLWGMAISPLAQSSDKNGPGAWSSSRWSSASLADAASRLVVSTPSLSHFSTSSAVFKAADSCSAVPVSSNEASSAARACSSQDQHTTMP